MVSLGPVCLADVISPHSARVTHPGEYVSFACAGAATSKRGGERDRPERGPHSGDLRRGRFGTHRPTGRIGWLNQLPDPLRQAFVSVGTWSRVDGINTVGTASIHYTATRWSPPTTPRHAEASPIVAPDPSRLAVSASAVCPNCLRLRSMGLQRARRSGFLQGR